MPVASRAGSGDLVLGLVLGLLGPAAVLMDVSPLLLPAAVALGLVVLRLLQHPDAAVRLAVVIVLLPPGLLPPLAQSGLSAGSICLAATAVALAPRSAGLSHRPPLSTCLLLAAFVLWALMTMWWSVAPATGAEVLRRHALGLLLLTLIVVRTRDREGLDRLMDALSVAAWILVCCGLWALAFGDGMAQGRLAVFSMNPNQLGNVLLVLTAPVLWRAAAPDRASPARTAQAVLYLGSALALIALSGSRGSLLAYGLLLMGFAATRTMRRWGIAATALAMVLLVTTPSLFATVFQRFSSEDSSQLSRTTLWASGLSLIADHPFGVGIGVGQYAMPPYIDARVAQDHFQHRDQYPAHNPLIEVGTDTGLVGMTLYGSALVVAASTFAASVRRSRRRHDVVGLAYGAVIGSCSLAFLTVWSKSGGENYSFQTFMLLALWLVGGRAQRGSMPAKQHQATATWSAS